jgi:hypothetical protein
VCCDAGELKGFRLWATCKKAKRKSAAQRTKLLFISTECVLRKPLTVLSFVPNTGLDTESTAVPIVWSAGGAVIPGAPSVAKRERNPISTNSFKPYGYLQIIFVF